MSKMPKKYKNVIVLFTFYSDGWWFVFLFLFFGFQTRTITAYLQGVTMHFYLLSFMFNFKILVFCQFLKEKNYFALYFLYFLPPIGFISAFRAIARTVFSNSAYSTSGRRVAISAMELLG